jgi:hypothetical protein
MIKHIVMWKLKEFAEGASKSENAGKLKTRLEALPSLIKELKAVEVGINCIPSEAAYDVVWYSEFENKEALFAYQKHPEHQRLISEFLDKVRIDKKVVDYEV